MSINNRVLSDYYWQNAEKAGHSLSHIKKNSYVDSVQLSDIFWDSISASISGRCSARWFRQSSGLNKLTNCFKFGVLFFCGEKLPFVQLSLSNSRLKGLQHPSLINELKFFSVDSGLGGEQITIFERASLEQVLKVLSSDGRFKASECKELLDHFDSLGPIFGSRKGHRPNHIHRKLLCSYFVVYLDYFSVCGGEPARVEIYPRLSDFQFDKLRGPRLVAEQIDKHLSVLSTPFVRTH